MRPIIQARLEVGLLPAPLQSRFWAGPGRDKPCDACDSNIGYDDTEIEVDFIREGTFRFHVGCHIVWRGERQGGSNQSVGK